MTGAIAETSGLEENGSDPSTVVGVRKPKAQCVISCETTHLFQDGLSPNHVDLKASDTYHPPREVCFTQGLIGWNGCARKKGWSPETEGKPKPSARSCQPGGGPVSKILFAQVS